MQIGKRVYWLAFPAAALIAIVLAMSGYLDIAVTVAVAAGLVGMYVLRQHARARLIAGGRPPSDGDQPGSRRQDETSDDRTGRTRAGTMTGPFY